MVATLVTAVLTILAGSVGAQMSTAVERQLMPQPVATPRPISTPSASPPTRPPVSLAHAPGGPAAAPPGPLPTRPAQPIPHAGPVVEIAPVVLAGSAGSAGSDGAPRSAGAGGPPVCDYRDILTPHHHPADWDRTLLDTVYRLPSGYAPADLVDTSAAGLNGGHAVRGLVLDDLRAMTSAARDAGAPLAVVSGYRSFSRQGATFQRWVESGGRAAALRTSARPGHSEHQLGTTLDLTSAGGAEPWRYGDWGATPAGAWVARNAWRFGFVVSYPRGSFARTCYGYEPWHVRYVGRERAAKIHASGLTPREVLWRLQ